MKRKVIYDKVPMPEKHENYVPVILTEATMRERYKKVLEQMFNKEMDVLIVYADREHGANFSYLTGFEPRFEEALLVLHRNGENYLVLGNESMKMERYSRLPAKAIHCSCFSLPYQPVDENNVLTDCLKLAGICEGQYIGCAGWKVFNRGKDGCEELFELPYFVISALKEVNARGKLANMSSVFQDNQHGVRVHVNADEVAYYEFGAGFASSKVLEAMNEVKPGKTEFETASTLSVNGQPLSVTTICASGQRFTNAVVFPRRKEIRKGEPVSITLGLRGGLSSRAAYAAERREDLPEKERDYIERAAIPYYKALTRWLEMIGIGISCAEIYDEINRILPKNEFFWTLNPGHYTADDEWVSSPFYQDSQVILESGMILQSDIIPSIPGYGGVSAEDGIVIAGEALQGQLKNNYPEVWARLSRRKYYVEEILGIRLKKEVFPMSDICGYFRPFLLNHEYALRWIEE